MGSRAFFEGLGDFCTDYLFIPYEMVGNVFNYSVIVLGFVGLFYWLNFQRKSNAKAFREGRQK